MKTFHETKNKIMFFPPTTGPADAESRIAIASTLAIHRPTPEFIEHGVSATGTHVNWEWKSKLYTDTRELLLAYISTFANREMEDDIAPPNPTSIQTSKAILCQLIDLGIIPYVAPSHDEGIIFEFTNLATNTFYIIEIFNSGEIVLLNRKDGEDSEADEFSLTDLKDRLTTELQS